MGWSGNINPSKAKKIIDAMADDVERIATGIQAELVPFKNTFGTGLERTVDLPVSYLIFVATQQSILEMRYPGHQHWKRNRQSPRSAAWA